MRDEPVTPTQDAQDAGPSISESLARGAERDHPGVVEQSSLVLERPVASASHEVAARRPHPADLLTLDRPDRPSPPLTAPTDDAKMVEAATLSPVMTLDSTGFHGARSPTSAQLAGTLARAATRGDAAAAAAESRAQDDESATPLPPSRRHQPSQSQSNGGSKPEKPSRDAATAGTAPGVTRADASSIPASRRQLGEWTLGKTLGAGSMGKVKLAVSNVSGEKVAVKIVPRFTSTASVNAQKAAAQKHQTEAAPAASMNVSTSASSAPTSTKSDGGGGGGGGDDAKPSRDSPKMPTRSYIERAQAKDLSKEVRTVREASIVLLLHHPYICGMRSMLVYPHHYYMVFEYVNGGQMLDYIISHGRLRERSARKFARQIGSALEYCHANSIVHRDLKIENILISKTGNIKIIDFGLSNLYSPRSQLSTFCGSLYFAAPELLNAKPYIGPEVDLWSYGIVLYVLVCGKVPFDDQSMPALHAKIKRGQVEYPAWLSAECKHLLSRMLVTSPHHRASLHEILNHPWMVKTFEGPPSPHLPPREPLRLGEIDREVIKGMTGFEFGSAEAIEARIGDVLASEAYCLVLKAYDERKDTVNRSAAHISVTDGDAMSRPRGSEGTKPLRAGSKRFSGFDFYRKKLSSLASNTLSLKADGDDRDDTLLNLKPETLLALGGKRPEELDPTRGFDPMLSVYFLVREKIEREKIYGQGVFASSTLSLNGPPPPPLPAQAYRQPAQAHFEPSRGIRFRSDGSSALPTPTDELLNGSRLSASAPTSPQQRSAKPRIDAAIGEEVAPSPLRIAETHPTAEPPMTENGVAGGATPTTALARRFSNLLGRATSVSEADYRRHRQRASLGSVKAPASTLPHVEEPKLATGESLQSGAQTAHTDGPRSAPNTTMTAAPSTSLNRASRHASMVQRKRPSTGDVEAMDARENQQTISQASAGLEADRAEGEGEASTKPVYLKGLFSVATTSTKAPQVIRNDLRIVLERLGVQHREIKGGFECSHAPSIDLDKMRATANEDGGRTTSRRTSRLGAPGQARGLPSPQVSDVSFGSPQIPPASNAIDRISTSSTRLPHNADVGIDTAAPGEPAMLVGDIADDLVIRFDIFVIKVPWLPGIHGLQFRRRQGNAWTYSMLARRVLADLKL